MLQRLVADMLYFFCISIKFNPQPLRLKSRSVEQVILEVEHLTQKLTVMEQT